MLTGDRPAGGGRTRSSLVVGAGMCIVVVVAALAAPLLAPADPVAQTLEHRLAPPSADHPLGLDELGRDVLSRLLWGARASLAVGFSVVLLAGATGALLGAAAGYGGGMVDTVVMRAVDVVLAFPGILLAIALVGVLGPGLENVVLALVLIGWADYARLVRSRVLTLRETDFVAAARVVGARPVRIVVRHLVPNVMPVLAVQASLGMAGAILAEAGLSFLGLGVVLPAASWGAMIDAGRAFLVEAPHVALFPGLAILWAVLGFNLLGDGLVDLLGAGHRPR